MARIDTLISLLPDDDLRTQLIEALEELTQHRSFGLVFERHRPESVLLEGQIRVGSVVARRVAPARHGVVAAIAGTDADVVFGDDPNVELNVADLLTVRRFGEPIYPALTKVGTVERGGDRPHHIAIEAENFHALQMLSYTHRHQVDCIYLDPPYNTGAKDWRYNNDYVDSADRYRHSKWLSFMERRLLLCRDLLTRDGVLIVTIDEYEVHRLGMLLQQTFPTARVQMVTIITNTAGSPKDKLFTSAEEYAFFCFFGDAQPAQLLSDMLADEDKNAAEQMWFPAIRGRGLNDLPSKRRNLVYPLHIEPTTGTIVGYGRTLEERIADGDLTTDDLDSWLPTTIRRDDELHEVWPISAKDGRMTVWQNNGPTALKLRDEGFMRVRRKKGDATLSAWTLAYIKSGHQKRVRAGEIPVVGHEPDGACIFGRPEGVRTVIPKTTWKRKLHDARNYGTSALATLVGPSQFNYPKSPWAVRDCLAAAVGDNRNAVIVDVFAGSGTTMHATMMLNDNDGGSRTCVLVSNNEVGPDETARLAARGITPGHPAFDAAGIFRAVTRPRCEAVVTGQRADGSTIQDDDADGRSYAEGYGESVDFFKLDLLDPYAVEQGQHFDHLYPLLWMAAGHHGSCEIPDPSAGWVIAPEQHLAILLDDLQLADFVKLVTETVHEITHVWIVTDSESRFESARRELPDELTVGMLYLSYLLTFELNRTSN